MTTNVNEAGTTPDTAPTSTPTSTTPTKTKPGVAVANERPGHDLESDIQTRRGELIAKLAGLKTDERLEAAEERDKIKARLSELSFLIKENVVEGWANISNNAKIKLGHWLGQ